MSNLLVPMGGGFALVGDAVTAAVSSMVDMAIAELPADEQPVAESEREGIEAQLLQYAMSAGQLPESISLKKAAIP